MHDQPWPGDASSPVDAFRPGSISPVEALEATLAVIDVSELNACTHLDPEAARVSAKGADVTLPFGGVPVGIKELEAHHHQEQLLLDLAQIAERERPWPRVAP